jgi:starch synthase (maltosyl-transferring)
MARTRPLLDPAVARSSVPVRLGAAATEASGMPADGRLRAVIDAVQPAVDGGRFAVKRLLGQALTVTVHAFTDGHDQPRVWLCWRAEADGSEAQQIEMTPLGNDVWQASFTPPAAGRYLYTAVAWVDTVRSWRQELERRVDPADIRLAALAGAALAEEAAVRADGEDRQGLTAWAEELRRLAADPQADITTLQACALDAARARLIDRHPDRRWEARHLPELPLVVDRQRAGFSSWYELFPRSASALPGVHGRFADVEARLPAIAEMGFDVVYLPPIHPIGRLRRKGRNNALVAGADDVGSPWAIGAAEGGHTAILPALGTAQDFRRLVARAGELGMEIALDIAFQCAPDHPWVAEHPAWFRWRPDGSVQYAENPPKKYQDIYPFNFESDDWVGLWQALEAVFEHWIAEGVRIFRVDNPHTKAFAFWEWVITEVKRRHPDVIFLAEAFTRPKVMHRLAKLGFSQSYTYYTWRQTREELIAYFTELAEGPGREYFRPNAWPNTPDILTEQLHHAPPAVFMTRLLLAATLSGNYGIYGPAYELMEGRPREPGSEEYLDSEKYQLRHWNTAQSAGLREFITRVNRARRAHAALQGLHGELAPMRFFDTDNPQLMAYARRSLHGSSLVIAVVNLDPQFRQSGWVQVDAHWLGLDEAASFVVEDLLSGQRYHWHPGGNFVILDPVGVPAHLLHVRPGEGAVASLGDPVPAP